MTTRKTLTAACGIALALTLAGCAPEQSAPDPTPSFASEAEAFAAAEATYRAYVDALNAVDLSDPETFEGVYAWTTGEANAGERETLSQMHADRWVVDGETRVSLVQETAGAPYESQGVVALAVCLDISEVTVVDNHGQSVVDESRPDMQSMRISLIPVTASPTKFLISSIEGRDGEPQCGAQ